MPTIPGAHYSLHVFRCVVRVFFTLNRYSHIPVNIQHMYHIYLVYDSQQTACCRLPILCPTGCPRPAGVLARGEQRSRKRPLTDHVPPQLLTWQPQLLLLVITAPPRLLLAITASPGTTAPPRDHGCPWRPQRLLGDHSSSWQA